MVDVTKSQAPNSVTTGSVVNQELPGYYTDPMRQLSAQFANYMNQSIGQGAPMQGVAGFNGDQDYAMQMARGSMGNYMPYVNAGMDATGRMSDMAGMYGGMMTGAAGQMNPAAQYYGAAAMNSAGGPAQKWTDEFQKYMSPYTSQVVDNIGRLGQRNFAEKIMPGVQNAAIGSGNFGSTRNAEVLANAARESANDITGQQANALEQGYSTSAGIFNNDANRAMQGRQLASQTALGAGGLQQNALGAMGSLYNSAGNMGLSALGQQAGNYQSLGQMMYNNNSGDINRLMNVGNMQQQLGQQYMNTDYTNQMNAQNFPLTQMERYGQFLNGMRLPQTTTTANSGPSSIYNASPLAALFSGLGSMTGGSGNPSAAEVKAYLKSIGINV